MCEIVLEETSVVWETLKDKMERGEFKKHNRSLDTDLSCSPTVPFVVTVAATHF